MLVFAAYLSMSKNTMSTMSDVSYVNWNGEECHILHESSDVGIKSSGLVNVFK